MFSQYRLTIIVGFLILAVNSTPSRGENAYLKPHERIMWVGDSITAQNIYEPYVMRVLRALYPDGDFSDVNMGVGGATASSRAPGIVEPAEKEKPTLMTAMFGVNDTGWGINDPEQKIATYAAGLQKIADVAAKNHAELLFLRETHFSHNRDAQALEIGLDALLMKLFAAQDKVAAANGATVVDGYGAYTRELTNAWRVDPKFEFTPNFVHPTNYGHSAVAGEILKALGAGLPLSAGEARGRLHVTSSQAVELSAVGGSQILSPDGKLAIQITAKNLTAGPLDGNVVAVVGDQKFTVAMRIAGKGSATGSFEVPVSALSRRWEVQPIYLAYIGKDVFAATEVPLYYAHIEPTAGKPFTHDEKGWFEWEGKNAPDTTVSDISTTVGADSVRVEFRWKDSTPVSARTDPYKQRLGEPVTTPLDMTSPFGQPCDAVEILLDLRDEHSAGRYTSNMDSIPQGTARVGLYKIEENGKLACKLQATPESLAGAFKLSELGNDRYRIEYTGQVAASGVGFNMFVTDAQAYAPNKTKGVYMTTVDKVGTDWADFVRLSSDKRAVLCRVGY